MARVLLVNPPQRYRKSVTDFSAYFPLGLMYLAAKVRDACDVEIYDCCVSNHSDADGDVITYGDPPDRIREALARKKPDVVGISVPFTTQYGSAVAVANICREVLPGVTTVFGGPDPSVRYSSILEDEVCDYCVVGEGEETFHEFVRAFSSGESPVGIPGLASRENGTAVFKPREFLLELDELPFPAFDLIDVDGYFSNPFLYRNRSNIHKKSISLVTSRGCPFRCVFCSIRLHMGRKFRAHSPEYVMKLLQYCVTEHDVRNFHFEDDNLTFDRKRFEVILDRIIEERLDIKWDTPNGVRADTLSRDLLEKAKRAGCYQLSIAVESGSQRVLTKVIRKGSKLDLVLETARHCRELGIVTRGFYVIGFPGETLEEIQATTELALRMFRQFDLFPTLMIATPLYGTELYDICKQERYIAGDPTPEELSNATQSKGCGLIATPEFSTEDIRRVVADFETRLKRERFRFSLRHPVETLGLVRQRVQRKLLKTR